MNKNILYCHRGFLVLVLIGITTLAPWILVSRVAAAKVAPQSRHSDQRPDQSDPNSQKPSSPTAATGSAKKDPRPAGSTKSAQNAQPRIETYKVKLVVVDQQRKPVDDATVWASVPIKLTKTEYGWQFEINQTDKPKDGKLIVYASRESVFLSGRQEVKLANASNLSVTVPLSAEEGVLHLHVSDLSGNPIEGVRLSTTVPGSIVTPTDISGNCRIRLASPATLGAEVELVLIDSELMDLAIISPWDHRVFFLPLADKSQKIALAKREKKEELLGTPEAVLTMARQINAAVVPETADEKQTEGRKEAALTLVAKAFKLKPEDVDKAIRDLGQRSNDPYEVAQAHLYAGEYSEAVKYFSESSDLREEEEREAEAKVADAKRFLGQTYYEQEKYSEAATTLEQARKRKPNDVAILRTYGFALMKDGQFASAEEVFSQALNLSKKESCLCSDEASGMLNLALAYQYQGKYTQAEPLYRQALAMKEKAVGPKSWALAYYLDGLAQIQLFTFGDPELLFQRALEIRKANSSSAALVVAASLHNLGVYYRYRDRFDRAEGYLKQALEIQEKTPTGHQSDLALTLNNLGELYSAQAKTDEAEARIQRALSIRRQILRPDHPDIAASLSYLAAVFQSQGKDVEAEKAYKEALAIQEKAFGPQSSFAANTRVGLAGLYQSRSEFEEAQAHYEEALKALRIALRPDHPDIANALAAEAGLNLGRGRYEGVEEQSKQAVTILEKAYGPDSIAIAGPLINLARLYEIQAKYLKSESSAKRALAIIEKAFGKNHPNAIDVLTELSTIYQAKEEFGKSQLIREQILKTLEHTKGPQDPLIAQASNNLAWTLFLQHKYDAARPFADRAVKMVRTKENVGLMSSVLDTQANILSGQGNDAEAEQVFREALIWWEKLPDDPNVAVTMVGLAKLYTEQGRYDEAEPLFLKAIDIQKEKLGAENPERIKSLKEYASLLRKTNREREAAQLEAPLKSLVVKQPKAGRNK